MVTTKTSICVYSRMEELPSVLGGKNFTNFNQLAVKFVGERKEPIVLTPISAVKNEREIFVAKCHVIPMFDGYIVFYKDNRTVMTNNNRTNITVKQNKDFRNVTMVIQNLTVNDSGTYKCGKRDVLTNDYAAAVTLVFGHLHFLDCGCYMQDTRKIDIFWSS